MTKRTGKPRRVKARAINRVDYGLVGSPMIPIWELPRTAAAYDAMVEQMALGICRDAGVAELTRKYAIAALQAIGITRPRDLEQAAPKRNARKRQKANSQEALDNAMADWVSSYPRD